MATTRKFGIITSLAGLTGGIMVNSLSFNETAEIAEARNETGEITDYVGFSRATTVSVTGVMDTAKGDLATAGSVLTLGGKDYIIDSVSRNQNNTAFVEVTISARTADNAIITVINDGSSSSSESSGSSN